MSDIADDADFQIQQQGLASYKTSDGEVFVFTTETLEVLLAKSIESGVGKVLVVMKSRPSA
jgi:hypothetical protein